MSSETPATDNVENTPPTPMQQDNLFDLRILVRELWRWKWLLILAALIGVAMGVKNAHEYSPMYEAQMIVAPASDGSFTLPTGGGGSLFGAAQSFGLIGKGGAANSSFDHFKQTIRSRGLAEVLQNKHGLLQTVYRGSWDTKNNTWISPKVDETSLRWRIKRFFHYNFPQVPDQGTLAGYIGGMVKIGPVKASPFFKISVEHPDRDFALHLLEVVHTEADALIAASNRRKQKHDKRYLESQLKKTQLAEVRSTLLAMLMQREQKAMVVNSEPPHTIKILESPWVSKQPKEPQLLRIIGVPAGIALALAVIVLTMVVSFRLE
jgi:hypothetical protein